MEEPALTGPPASQEPADAWRIETVMAVILPFDVDPTAVAQSPATTDEAGTVASRVNAVVDVQLMVTWPVCWFCTSIDVPVMAATVPKAPGRAVPPDPPTWSSRPRPPGRA